MRRSPSSKATVGSQPSTSRAIAISAYESRRSPARGGAYRFSTGFARSRDTVSARSFTVFGEPAATLRIRPFAPSASAARRFASTTLSTYVKSRDWPPSPKIVTGAPSAIEVMKSGTTAAYCENGFCHGPKTLK